MCTVQLFTNTIVVVCILLYIKTVHIPWSTVVCFDTKNCIKLKKKFLGKLWGFSPDSNSTTFLMQNCPLCRHRRISPAIKEGGCWAFTLQCRTTPTMDSLLFLMRFFVDFYKVGGRYLPASTAALLYIKTENIKTFFLDEHYLDSLCMQIFVSGWAYCNTSMTTAATNFQPRKVPSLYFPHLVYIEECI